MYAIDNSISIKDLSYESNSYDNILERVTDPFYKKYCATTRLEVSKHYRGGEELTVVRKLSSHKGNINIMSEHCLFMRKDTISNWIYRSYNEGIMDIVKGEYMTDNECSEVSFKDILTKYKTHKMYKRNRI